ncbi:MAG: hypothetical protein WAW61_10715 [Methylococcaceae bacterium]
MLTLDDSPSGSQRFGQGDLESASNLPQVFQVSPLSLVSLHSEVIVLLELRE